MTDQKVSRDEVIEKLTGWWRDKSIGDEDWEQWSKNIEVFWELSKSEGDDTNV